jgi:hypothetical protein
MVCCRIDFRCSPGPPGHVARPALLALSGAASGTGASDTCVNPGGAAPPASDGERAAGPGSGKAVTVASLSE